MKRWLAVLVLSLPAAAGPAADTARAIRENSFDRGECYRVRDLTLIRGDVRIYLTDGYLMFSRPVLGRRVAAVFTADTQGGDAEVIVMPPTKGERRSLAAFTGTPNLDEHFKSAMFLGAGDLYGELTGQMGVNPTNRKVAEMAPLLDEQWGSVLRNLSGSYEARLTLDLLGGAGPGEAYFSGIFSGTKAGNFDVLYDPRAPEQVTVGQVANRDGRTFFDIWTSFEARGKPRRESAFYYDAVLSDYRIQATVQPDLTVSAVTRIKVKPRKDRMGVIAFDIAREMRVESATVNGSPAEVLQRESLRGNLGRGGNELFLVVPPEPLAAGREYEFEFRHSGNVIHDAGDRVLYVTARGNWYPAHGLQYATFDLTFRYAKDLDLVSAGEIVEDVKDGEWRVTRRRTGLPVRLAGFNLGSYLHARSKKGPYVVEIYANRSLERALQPKPSASAIILPEAPGPRRRSIEQPIPMITPPPNPANHLQKIGAEIVDALDFMAGKFGAPALPFLTVSPIPGTFGQGFPGLIYLSTMSYLRGTSATARLTGPQEAFFSEILQAHETAHQWWGNVVSAAGYHDYWLMEALANYSALLYLEHKKGPKVLEQALEQYRNELLMKSPSGEPVDAAGPIVLGTRLESSLEPRAWRAITYGKGSWIVHMLRGMMGDERFLRMLAEFRRKYERQEVTTEEFRAVAASYLPAKSEDPKLEAFFDQWVYNTGIPSLKMSHGVKGKVPALRVTGTITQSEVGEDFSVLVPVEVQFARGKQVHWVRTGGEPAEFSIPVKQMPVKVSLDPHFSTLRR
jgi:hypothetical protein